MKYSRAFFVAFVILIIGLGLYWYSTSQIDAELEADKMPSFQWFQYQTWGLMILGFGIALFVFFIGVAVKNWIGMQPKKRKG